MYLDPRDDLFHEIQSLMEDLDEPPDELPIAPASMDAGLYEEIHDLIVKLKPAKFSSDIEWPTLRNTFLTYLADAGYKYDATANIFTKDQDEAPTVIKQKREKVRLPKKWKKYKGKKKRDVNKQREKQSTSSGSADENVSRKEVLKSDPKTADAKDITITSSSAAVADLPKRQTASVMSVSADTSQDTVTMVEENKGQPAQPQTTQADLSTHSEYPNAPNKSAMKSEAIMPQPSLVITVKQSADKPTVPLQTDVKPQYQNVQESMRHTLQTSKSTTSMSSLQHLQSQFQMIGESQLQKPGLMAGQTHAQAKPQITQHSHLMSPIPCSSRLITQRDTFSIAPSVQKATLTKSSTATSKIPDRRADHSYSTDLSRSCFNSNLGSGNTVIEKVQMSQLQASTQQNCNFTNPLTQSPQASDSKVSMNKNYSQSSFIQRNQGMHMPPNRTVPVAASQHSMYHTSQAMNQSNMTGIQQQPPRPLPAITNVQSQQHIICTPDLNSHQVMSQTIAKKATLQSPTVLTTTIFTNKPGSNLLLSNPVIQTQRVTPSVTLVMSPQAIIAGQSVQANSVSGMGGSEAFDDLQQVLDGGQPLLAPVPGSANMSSDDQSAIHRIKQFLQSESPVANQAQLAGIPTTTHQNTSNLVQGHLESTKQPPQIIKNFASASKPSRPKFTGEKLQFILMQNKEGSGELKEQQPINSSLSSSTLGPQKRPTHQTSAAFVDQIPMPQPVGHIVKVTKISQVTIPSTSTASNANTPHSLMSNALPMQAANPSVQSPPMPAPTVLNLVTQMKSNTKPTMQRMNKPMSALASRQMLGEHVPGKNTIAARDKRMGRTHLHKLGGIGYTQGHQNLPFQRNAVSHSVRPNIISRTSTTQPRVKGDKTTVNKRPSAPHEASRSQTTFARENTVSKTHDNNFGAITINTQTINKPLCEGCKGDIAKDSSHSCCPKNVSLANHDSQKVTGYKREASTQGIKTMSTSQNSESAGPQENDLSKINEVSKAKTTIEKNEKDSSQDSEEDSDQGSSSSEEMYSSSEEEEVEVVVGPYFCKMCNQGFGTRVKRQRHEEWLCQKKETDPKEFEVVVCEFCDREVSSLHGLRLHLRRMHPDLVEFAQLPAKLLAEMPAYTHKGGKKKKNKKTNHWKRKLKAGIKLSSNQVSKYTSSETTSTDASSSSPSSGSSRDQDDSTTTTSSSDTNAGSPLVIHRDPTARNDSGHTTESYDVEDSDNQDNWEKHEEAPMKKKSVAPQVKRSYSYEEPPSPPSDTSADLSYCPSTSDETSSGVDDEPSRVHSPLLLRPLYHSTDDEPEREPSPLMLRPLLPSTDSGVFEADNQSIQQKIPIEERQPAIAIRPCFVKLERLSATVMQHYLKNDLHNLRHCAHCGAGFHDVDKLSDHIQTHLSEKHSPPPKTQSASHLANLRLPKHPCKICGKKFLTSKAVLEHTVANHLSPGKNAADINNRVEENKDTEISQRFGLLEWKAISYAQIAMYQTKHYHCSGCPNFFPSAIAWERHRKKDCCKEFNIMYKYHCLYCPSVVYQAPQTCRHHTLYACESYPKRRVSVDQLTQKCLMCGVVFLSAMALQAHMAIKHRNANQPISKEQEAACSNIEKLQDQILQESNPSISNKTSGDISSTENATQNSEHDKQMLDSNINDINSTANYVMSKEKFSPTKSLQDMSNDPDMYSKMLEHSKNMSDMLLAIPGEDDMVGRNAAMIVQSSSGDGISQKCEDDHRGFWHTTDGHCDSKSDLTGDMDSECSISPGKFAIAIGKTDTDEDCGNPYNSLAYGDFSLGIETCSSAISCISTDNDSLVIQQVLNEILIECEQKNKRMLLQGVYSDKGEFVEFIEDSDNCSSASVSPTSDKLTYRARELTRIPKANKRISDEYDKVKFSLVVSSAEAVMKQKEQISFQDGSDDCEVFSDEPKRKVKGCINVEKTSTEETDNLVDIDDALEDDKEEGEACLEIRSTVDSDEETMNVISSTPHYNNHDTIIQRSDSKPFSPTQEIVKQLILDNGEIQDPLIEVLSDNICDDTLSSDISDAKGAAGSIPDYVPNAVLDGRVLCQFRTLPVYRLHYLCCLSCQEYFPTMTELDHHQIHDCTRWSQYTSIYHYQCYFCDRVFRAQNDYYNHLRLACEKFKKTNLNRVLKHHNSVICPLCKEVFFLPTEVRKHLVGFHEKTDHKARELMNTHGMPNSRMSHAMKLYAAVTRLCPEEYQDIGHARGVSSKHNMKQTVNVSMLVMKNRENGNDGENSVGYVPTLSQTVMYTFLFHARQSWEENNTLCFECLYCSTPQGGVVNFFEHLVHSHTAYYLHGGSSENKPETYQGKVQLMYEGSVDDGIFALEGSGYPEFFNDSEIDMSVEKSFSSDSSSALEDWPMPALHRHDYESTSSENDPNDQFGNLSNTSVWRIPDQSQNIANNEKIQENDSGTEERETPADKKSGDISDEGICDEQQEVSSDHTLKSSDIISANYNNITKSNKPAIAETNYHSHVHQKTLNDCEKYDDSLPKCQNYSTGKAQDTSAVKNLQTCSLSDKISHIVDDETHRKEVMPSLSCDPLDAQTQSQITKKDHFASQTANTVLSPETCSIEQVKEIGAQVTPTIPAKAVSQPSSAVGLYSMDSIEDISDDEVDAEASIPVTVKDYSNVSDYQYNLPFQYGASTSQDILSNSLVTCNASKEDNSLSDYTGDNNSLFLESIQTSSTLNDNKAVNEDVSRGTNIQGTSDTTSILPIVHSLALLQSGALPDESSVVDLYKPSSLENISEDEVDSAGADNKSDSNRTCKHEVTKTVPYDTTQELHEENGHPETAVKGNGGEEIINVVLPKIPISNANLNQNDGDDVSLHCVSSSSSTAPITGDARSTKASILPITGDAGINIAEISNSTMLSVDKNMEYEHNVDNLSHCIVNTTTVDNSTDSEDYICTEKIPSNQSVIESPKTASKFKDSVKNEKWISRLQAVANMVAMSRKRKGDGSAKKLALLKKAMNSGKKIKKRVPTKKRRTTAHTKQYGQKNASTDDDGVDNFQCAWVDTTDSECDVAKVVVLAESQSMTVVENEEEKPLCGIGEKCITDIGGLKEETCGDHIVDLKNSLHENNEEQEPAQANLSPQNLTKLIFYSTTTESSESNDPIWLDTKLKHNGNSPTIQAIHDHATPSLNESETETAQNCGLQDASQEIELTTESQTSNHSQDAQVEDEDLKNREQNDVNFVCSSESVAKVIEEVATPLMKLESESETSIDTKESDCRVLDRQDKLGYKENLGYNLNAAPFVNKGVRVLTFPKLNEEFWPCHVCKLAFRVKSAWSLHVKVTHASANRHSTVTNQCKNTPLKKDADKSNISPESDSENVAKGEMNGEDSYTLSRSQISTENSDQSGDEQRLDDSIQLKTETKNTVDTKLSNKSVCLGDDLKSSNDTLQFNLNWGKRGLPLKNYSRIRKKSLDMATTENPLSNRNSSSEETDVWDKIVSTPADTTSREENEFEDLQDIAKNIDEKEINLYTKSETKALEIAEDDNEDEIKDGQAPPEENHQDCLLKNDELIFDKGSKEKKKTNKSQHQKKLVKGLFKPNKVDNRKKIRTRKAKINIVIRSSTRKLLKNKLKSVKPELKKPLCSSTHNHRTETKDQKSHVKAGEMRKKNLRKIVNVSTVKLQRDDKRLTRRSTGSDNTKGKAVETKTSLTKPKNVEKNINECKRKAEFKEKTIKSSKIQKLEHLLEPIPSSCSSSSDKKAKIESDLLKSTEKNKILSTTQTGKKKKTCRKTRSLASDVLNVSSGKKSKGKADHKKSTVVDEKTLNVNATSLSDKQNLLSEVSNIDAVIASVAHNLAVSSTKVKTSDEKKKLLATKRTSVSSDKLDISCVKDPIDKESSIVTKLSKGKKPMTTDKIMSISLDTHTLSNVKQSSITDVSCSRKINHVQNAVAKIGSDIENSSSNKESKCEVGSGPKKSKELKKPNTTKRKSIVHNLSNNKKEKKKGFLSKKVKQAKKSMVKKEALSASDKINLSEHKKSKTKENSVKKSLTGKNLFPTKKALLASIDSKVSDDKESKKEKSPVTPKCAESNTKKKKVCPNKSKVIVKNSKPIETKSTLRTEKGSINDVKPDSIAEPSKFMGNKALLKSSKPVSNKDKAGSSVSSSNKYPILRKKLCYDGVLIKSPVNTLGMVITDNKDFPPHITSSDDKVVLECSKDDKVLSSTEEIPKSVSCQIKLTAQPLLDCKVNLPAKSLRIFSKRKLGLKETTTKQLKVEEPVQMKCKSQTVQAKYKNQAVLGKCKSQAVRAKCKSQAVEAKCKSQAVEAKCKSQAVQAKYKSQAVQSKGKKQAVTKFKSPLKTTLITTSRGKQCAIRRKSCESVTGNTLANTPVKPKQTNSGKQGCKSDILAKVAQPDTDVPLCKRRKTTSDICVKQTVLAPSSPVQTRSCMIRSRLRQSQSLAPPSQRASNIKSQRLDNLLSISQMKPFKTQKHIKPHAKRKR